MGRGGGRPNHNGAWGGPPELPLATAAAGGPGEGPPEPQRPTAAAVGPGGGGDKLGWGHIKILYKSSNIFNRPANTQQDLNMFDNNPKS